MTDKRGPLLLWGRATGFEFYFPGAAKLDDRPIGLLIEWNSLDDATKAAGLVSSLGVSVADVYRGGHGSPVRQMWAVDVKLGELDRFLAAVEPLLRRVELAAPIGPSRARGTGTERRISETSVLAALMDDGCAFANERFTTNGKTRVLWVWNQDPEAAGTPLNASTAPSPPVNFNYGGQWSGPQLDAIIAAAGTQDRIYRDAAFPGLTRAAAHGSHVMDLLAGRDAWDLVFVQFSQACVDDPTGVWLDRYGIDGLEYILACAGPNTQKIVVNISWGPQTGPHDGTSPLEAKIDELVAAQPKGRELIVTLAAGNAYSAQAHAQLAYSAGGRFDWIVPPDSSTPAFIEVWWPKSVTPQDAHLRVVSPSGRVVQPMPASVQPPLKEHYSLIHPPGQGAMAQVTVHPTEHPDASKRGEHGRWRFELAPGTFADSGDIHVYVARADHNMGRRRRAKASYLVDEPWMQARFAPPAARAKEAPGSAIRRHGTLSGIATGYESSVAAGYTFVGFKSAAYSSAGPSRGPRARPDFACATDRSLAVPGIRACGVRSGTVYRLVGTSTAAPQLGRQLARGSFVQFIPPSYEPERVGTSCLVPDVGVIHRS